MCPPIIHDIEDNDPIDDEEDIHLTRENPEVLSANESCMDVWEEDMLANTGNIQDAFIFCPNIGTIKMDNIIEQGIFISENEMSQMEETKNSICNKFTTIMFEEKDSTKSKIATG